MMKRIITCMFTAFAMLLSAVPVHALDHLVWKEEGGKQYWYENGTRQGMMGDPKNITDTVYGYERGREIYDPASDGWYWLDAIYNGAKAENKEVWMPYIYQSDMAAGINKEGKWVRYNADGKMVKGWYTPVGTDALLYPEQVGNLYYYDLITGQMVKGDYAIDGTLYHFDEVTGILADINYGWDFPDRVWDFLDTFIFGYGLRYGDLVYSAANPALNSKPIIERLINPFIRCVDYSIYPGNPPVAVSEGGDLNNWYPEGYVMYDAHAIDWISKNILNLSEADFAALFAEEEAKKYCYCEEYFTMKYYYTANTPAGVGGPIPEMKFDGVYTAGDIYIVTYATYAQYYDEDLGDFAYSKEPLEHYVAYLQYKKIDGSYYWSILANTIVK